MHHVWHRSTGENVVVGGENLWAYKSFVNYDFFPSEQTPILVYFKCVLACEPRAASPAPSLAPHVQQKSVISMCF